MRPRHPHHLQHYGPPISTVARFTIAEYDCMIEAGVFDAREKHRVELILGEIRDMRPVHPPHENALDLLMYWSIDHAPRDKVRIRVQNSLGVPELESVPQPDLLWVKQRDYSKARPTCCWWSKWPIPASITTAARRPSCMPRRGWPTTGSSMCGPESSKCTAARPRCGMAA